MERDANFYMANLGSEFLRLIAARDSGKAEALAESAKRCLAIIDSALSFGATKGQREEMGALKKIIEDCLRGVGNGLSVTRKEAESYFYPFAARQTRRP